MIIVFGLIAAACFAILVLCFLAAFAVPLLLLFGPAFLWFSIFGQWGMGPWLIVPGAVVWIGIKFFAGLSRGVA
jgi:hypothetical protein